MERAAEYVELSPVTTADRVLAMRESLERVEVTPDLLDYIVAIVSATRRDAQVQIGASPRRPGAGSAGPGPGAAGQPRLRDPRRHQAGGGARLADRVTLRPELWVRQVSCDEVMTKLLAAVPTPKTDPARPVTG